MTKKNLTLDLNNFPEWSEFNWIEFEIVNSLEALKKLHQINREAFTNICIDLESKLFKLREDNKDLSTQDLSDYQQHLYGLEEQIILELNNVQNSSIIIYAFTIFENKLKMITDRIQNGFKFTVTTKNRDSYTSEYWKILKCFSKLKVEKLEKYFTPLKCQTVIRNIIVHQNNIASDKQFKSINKVKGLIFNEFEEQYFLVNIEYEFVEQLITRLEIFFRELLDILKSETNERIKNIG
jgi:hypothetical protein